MQKPFEIREEEIKKKKDNIWQKWEKYLLDTDQLNLWNFEVKV